jgi:hypothetical protein
VLTHPFEFFFWIGRKVARKELATLAKVGISLPRGFFQSGYRAYTPMEATEEELLLNHSGNVLWVHHSAKELTSLLQIQKMWPFYYGEDHRNHTF